MRSVGEDRVVGLYRRWLALVFPAGSDPAFLSDIARVFADGHAAAAERGRLPAVRYILFGFFHAAIDGAAERLPLFRGGLREARSGLGLDLRVALRAGRARPFLAATAILSLTVGIGLNAILYTAVDALLFTPLEVPAPDRLVRIFDPNARRTLRSAVPMPVIEALDREARAFEGVAGVSRTRVGLAWGEEARLVPAERVTPAYFRTLGVEPVRGRGLSGADGEAGAEPVAVVSERLLASLGSGAGSGPGTIVRINGVPRRVVGVAPAGFVGSRFLSPAELWIPLQAGASAPVAVEALGRLRSGVSREEAESEVRRIVAGVPGMSAMAGAAEGYYLLGEREGLINPAMPHLVDIGAGLALGGFLLLLLIACANTGAILLARTAARSDEIALRRALGATRARLTRQFMLETATLVLPAVVIGAAAAAAAGPIFEALVPPIAGLDLDFSPDPRLILFLAAIALLATILATAMPLAVALRGDRRAAGGRGTVAGVRRSLDLVIVAQTTLATVVLLAAGLFYGTWDWYRSADPGYATHGRVAITLDAGLYGLDAAVRDAFYRELASRVAARPGVRGVALAAGITVGGPDLAVRGLGPDGAAGAVAANRVSAGYFRTLDVRLEEGRGFTEGDGTRPVVIVNAALARRLWPQGRAVGRVIETEGESLEVVGVAPVLRYAALAEPPRPFLYRPVEGRLEDRMVLIVHGGDDEARTLAAVRETIRQLRPGFVPLDATTLSDRVAEDRLLARTGALLGAVAGGLSLFLAALGVYGSLGYSVHSRRAELGVRAALGAHPRRLFRAIAARALALGGVGLAAGLVVGIALAVAARDLFFGTDILDPTLHLAVAGAVLVGLTLALAGPAGRASRLDPATALRSDER